MEDNGPENISFKNPEQIRFMNKDIFRISTEYPIKAGMAVATSTTELGKAFFSMI